MVLAGTSIKLGNIFNEQSLSRNVPLDVRTRQFKTMAAMYGRGVEEFGLLIENIRSEERTQLLGVFYTRRRELLASMGLESEDEGL